MTRAALKDLLARVRPGSEAAPWVVAELERIADLAASEEMVQVATVDSVDEYGPCLTWTSHWSGLVGQPLFAAAP